VVCRIEGACSPHFVFVIRSQLGRRRELPARRHLGLLTGCAVLIRAAEVKPKACTAGPLASLSELSPPSLLWPCASGIAPARRLLTGDRRRSSGRRTLLSCRWPLQSACKVACDAIAGPVWDPCPAHPTPVLEAVSDVRARWWKDAYRRRRSGTEAVQRTRRVGFAADSGPRLSANVRTAWGQNRN
jgi:hypothetical protein